MKVRQVDRWSLIPRNISLRCSVLKAAIFTCILFTRTTFQKLRTNNFREQLIWKLQLFADALVSFFYVSESGIRKFKPVDWRCCFVSEGQAATLSLSELFAVARCTLVLLLGDRVLILAALHLPDRLIVVASGVKPIFWILLCTRIYRLFDGRKIARLRTVYRFYKIIALSAVWKSAYGGQVILAQVPDYKVFLRTKYRKNGMVSREYLRLVSGLRVNNSADSFIPRSRYSPNNVRHSPNNDKKMHTN